MVNYNSNDFYFDRTKYRNNTNISTTINKQNYGDDDLTIVDPNEYQFKYYDRFDTYKGLFNTQQLIGAVDFNKFESLIGIKISQDKALEILNSLGFKADKNFKVEVPSKRHDIFSSEDLVEEILRIYGYENIQKNIWIVF